VLINPGEPIASEPEAVTEPTGDCPHCGATLMGEPRECPNPRCFAKSLTQPAPEVLQPAKLYPGSRLFGDPSKTYIDIGVYRLPVIGEPGRPDNCDDVAVAQGACRAWNVCVEVQPEYPHAGTVYVPAGYGIPKPGQWFKNALNDSPILADGNNDIMPEIGGDKRILLCEKPEPAPEACQHVNTFTGMLPRAKTVTSGCKMTKLFENYREACEHFDGGGDSPYPSCVILCGGCTIDYCRTHIDCKTCPGRCSDDTCRRKRNGSNETPPLQSPRRKGQRR
jgi:hypothetical protein